MTEELTLEEALQLATREKVHYVHGSKLRESYITGIELDEDNKEKIKVEWVYHHLDLYPGDLRNKIGLTEYVDSVIVYKEVFTEDDFRIKEQPDFPKMNNLFHRIYSNCRKSEEENKKLRLENALKKARAMLREEGK